MESVFFDMNPSMRQFTDNSIRSNSMLHRAQNTAEGKTKTSKSAKATKSGISMEASVSGEDMMGSMDLGEFRGGGSGFESFSSMSEEDEHHERQSANLAEMLASMKSSVSESAMSFVSDHHSPLNTNASLDNQLNNEQHVITNPENSSEENVNSESDNIPSYSNEIPVSDTDSKQAYQTSQEVNIDYEDNDETHTEPPAAVLVEKSPELNKTSNSDSVKISKDKQIVDKPEEKAPEKKSSEWNSLLSFDEGFLIADDEKFKSSSSEEAESSVHAIEKVTIPNDSEMSDDGINSIISSMLQSSEYLSDYEISVLNYYIGSFGSGILRLCLDSGVKIRVVPFDGSHFSGGYSKKDRTCFIPQASLSSKQEFVPARFYMAMAFDHSLGDGDFSSVKSPAVLNSWQLCRSLERGHLFQDLFSSSDPSLYFAQSAESFLREEGDVVSDSPFFNCEELYDYDRTMFSYMEYLFGKFGKKRSIK